MPVVQSLLVTMSKFLNLGLTIDQVVQMTSSNPAKALGEETRRGCLKPGMPANMTVLDIVEGEYLFSDGNGRHSMRGNRILKPRLVLKDGAETPCCSRLPHSASPHDHSALANELVYRISLLIASLLEPSV